MAMVHVIRKGDSTGSRHVGKDRTHNDPKDHLWLDGGAIKPEGYQVAAAQAGHIRSK